MTNRLAKLLVTAAVVAPAICAWIFGTSLSLSLMQLAAVVVFAVLFW